MMCAELVLPSDGLSSYLNVKKDARIVLCFSHCSSLSRVCLKYVGQNISLLRIMRRLPRHTRASIHLDRPCKFLAAFLAANTPERLREARVRSPTKGVRWWQSMLQQVHLWSVITYPTCSNQDGLSGPFRD